MPQNIINMLDGLMQNGGTPESKIRDAAQKATLEILSDIDANLTGVIERLDKHIDDKDCHTPKGLLVRGNVIFWAVSIMILISAIVAHAPELIKFIPK